MKTKQKILISLMLIALFLTTTCNAATSYTVEYPTEVKLGDEFTINIIFEYELDCNCLYGIHIWFCSAVNNEYTSSWSSGLGTYIYALENYPRPTNVSWTFGSTTFAYGALEINDTIQFKIKYREGYDDGTPVEHERTVVTHVYEITIVEETTETSALGIIPVVLILSATLIFTRKKKKRKSGMI